MPRHDLGSDADPNTVWADVDNSDVTAGGDITISAEMDAGIFALAIGAAGGVANSTSGSAFGIAGAGSASLNKIRNSTQAKVRNASSLTAFFKIPSNRVVELGTQIEL